MKRYLNYLYTDISKTLIISVALVLVWFTGSSALKTVNFYKEDSAATVNVLYQQENFDYDTSIFKQQEIRAAVQNVLTYALEYKGKSEPDESFDSDYYAARDALNGYRKVKFALVNHTTEKIVSNVEEINGADSRPNVREYFSGNPQSMLIVRDCHNPYYEAGTMTDFVDMVEELSVPYSDNFDIYISFPEDFLFAADEQEYRERHITYLYNLGAYLNRAVVLFCVAVLLIILLLIITGKKMAGGRIYSCSLDRIPNDMMTAFYIIVLLSLSALIENALYMIIRTTNNENFWLNISPDFYGFRLKACLVGFVATATCFACTLKRQLKLKTLLTNTYIYRFLRQHISKKEKRDE